MSCIWLLAYTSWDCISHIQICLLMWICVVHMYWRGAELHVHIITSTEELMLSPLSVWRFTQYNRATLVQHVTFWGRLRLFTVNLNLNIICEVWCTSFYIFLSRGLCCLSFLLADVVFPVICLESSLCSSGLVSTSLWGYFWFPGYSAS